MNSIRPLVTITILAVVGVWLYLKINESPARHEHGEAEAWHDPATEGVPPLAVTSAAPAADAGAAPKWPPVAATVPTVAAPQPAPTTLQPVPATTSTNGLLDMPAIPALPDVSTPPATAAEPVPVSLPADIPTAKYPDTSSTNAISAAVATSGDSTQIDPTKPIPDTTGIGSVPVAAPPSTADHESTIATDSAMAAVGLTPQPQPSQTPTNGADRYGLGATEPLNSLREPGTPPVEPTFADTWPVIQAALDRRELGRAHQLLSKWYGDDSLTPAEAERVNALLGQLAGTVVYSTEHQLEPAYVVKAGDTLGTIAQQFHLPWQLLAKINGIPSADSVQAGQSLKVLRGPFSAVVDLRRSQLTLMLDGRYAGKFPITVPTGSTVTEGQWLVDQKLVTAPASVTQTSYAQAPAAVDRAIVLRGEDASTGKPAPAGPTLTIASAPLATGAAGSPPAIRISPQDAEELSDILSVGSRVIVRR